MPKHLWANEVLPNMGARMGIRDSTYDPYEGFSFEEQYAMIQSGVYGAKPIISREDWQLLTDYIVARAPDSLSTEHILDSPTKENSRGMDRTLTQFTPQPVAIDSSPGSFLSFVNYDPKKARVITADLRGKVFEYDANKNALLQRFNLGNAITAFNQTDSIAYITTVGILDPSEIVAGGIHVLQDGSAKRLPFDFHRPVHTTVYDLNGNGHKEILVCEFGNLTGQLSLLTKQNDSIYGKRVLLARPGALRTVVHDMDSDGKDDIIAMTAQGDEGVSILYQTGNLDFREEQVVRFSPLYGSSWFELLDYDGDGDQDLITVHGDNGDKTPILKPYHGLRIYLNDGSNQFSETFFYPFYGASRSVSRDFDQDGDIDIALISTFPDYGKRPVQSFVYLENKNEDSFQFEPQGLPTTISGRWFLMGAGDVDNDGDEDIVISCFTYSFSPVPVDLKQRWGESDFDMLILENVLLE
ncbi:VCBS repeat-containing protein [Pricia sp. S334]|uniref:VCBS repeat-containing protein n=1 Tax=Pricia mediterranea TaxID=3076079 RepID=A0ABU3LA35_9FLAO|nr:VCBS repeat-containing protein [Pricia sp. S334]MDT7830161.1 VCBS repeat-containing protein [Pricia sp. S334]